VEVEGGTNRLILLSDALDDLLRHQSTEESTKRRQVATAAEGKLLHEAHLFLRRFFLDIFLEVGLEQLAILKIPRCRESFLVSTELIEGNEA
jgi:hypothetical protein